MFELGLDGSFDYPAGVVAPIVTPGPGTSQAEADRLNACIRRKAAAAGHAPAAAPSTTETLTVRPAGSDGRRTETYTYGRPPAGTSSPRRSRHAGRAGGGLPLPTQYALMPGDAQLWPQLTLAQRQRAMRFLDDGSTIRSSLKGD